MYDWIKETAASVGEWFGSGASSFMDWLLGGLADMFTVISEALQAVWDVIESLWKLASGFLGSLGRLLSLCFPFLPEPVATVISAALLVILITGIVKKVMGK